MKDRPEINPEILKPFEEISIKDLEKIVASSKKMIEELTAKINNANAVISKKKLGYGIGDMVKTVQPKNTAIHIKITGFDGLFYGRRFNTLLKEVLISQNYVVNTLVSEVNGEKYERKEIAHQ
jgi:hypothetical protein